MTATKCFLVTGAAGEVGFQVTKLLAESGRTTRAMVRKESSRTELSKLPSTANIVEADLTDRSSLEKAFQGVDGVFHVAAVYRESGLSDETFFNVNAEGTRNVFVA